MKSLTFTLESAPFDGEPEYAPIFFEQLGRINAVWSNIDSQLCEIVRLLAWGAKFDLGGRDVPHSTKQRLQLVRRLVKGTPTLDFVKRETLVLADQISKVVPDRNLIVHSNWEGFEDGSPPKIIMRSTRTKSGFVEIATYRLTIEEITNLAQEITKIQPIAMVVLVRIITTIGMPKTMPIDRSINTKSTHR